MTNQNDSNADDSNANKPVNDVLRERVLDLGAFPSSIAEAGTETTDPSVGPSATPISSCTTIDAPGEYVFETDISSSADTCIEITADDVVLDGQNHELKYTGESDDSVGIRITGSNVTVENTILERWGIGVVHSGYGGVIRSNVLDNTDRDLGTGITFQNAINVVFRNNEVTDFITGIDLNKASGNAIYANDVKAFGASAIDLEDSDANVVVDNEFTSPSIVVDVDTSNENRFESNDIRGDTALSLSDSVGNELVNNVVTNSLYGVSISNTTKTVLDGNAVIGQFSPGVTLSEADHCVLTDNVVQNNRGGIELEDADRNLLYGNVVCNNGDGEQIVLDEESEDNTVSNNLTNC